MHKITQEIEQLFASNKKLAYAITAIVVGLLMAVVVLLSVLLLGDSTTEKSSNNGGSGGQQTSSSGSSLSGNSSSLKGSVSTRSIDGLTLRINQIETCNPDVVSAYVAISSDEGVVSKGLNKSNVKVYLDNKEVKDYTFNAVDNTKQPISNALVIDKSGSMAGAPIENARAAARDYVSKLRPGDQVSVTQFSHTVETLVGMTSDKYAATNAINSIVVGGDTAVYDAVHAGAQTVPNCGRKAVTVLTDGDDRQSKSFNQNSLITALNTINLPVFAVGIKGEGFNPTAMRTVAESTGGQYLEANSPQEVTQLYSNIDGQLTGQFVANLKVSLPKNGQSHTLKVVSTAGEGTTSSQRSFLY